MPIEYTVKTEVFEGPLDLLLSLIEKRKLLINDISLSTVADDYMAYIRALGGFPVADVANFLLIASTLVFIKSKALLPFLTLTPEEEGDVADLERRLKIYKRIKDTVRHLKKMWGERIIFPRGGAGYIKPVFSPDQSVTVAGLTAAMHDVIGGFPKKEKMPEVAVRKAVSIEEMIERLVSRVENGIRSFNEFSNSKKNEKIEVIVSFLAMLELVKQGLLAVSQAQNFSDIRMEPHVKEKEPEHHGA